MNTSRLYEVALSLVPGVGNVLIRHLISYCGSAEKVFNTPRSKLQRVPGIGAKNARAIYDNQILDQAEIELARIQESGINLLYFTDAEYPTRLKQIYDAPTILYYRGEPVLNLPKVVGIVGTRKATTYGRGIVEEIIQGLKVYRPVIVSGLAYGIDIEAHQKALRYELKTVAVLASGVDIIYPFAHRQTAWEMTDQGGLLSENRLGTKPEAHLFPARNRIIAGLCDVILVIEAASRGGALITAEIANDYDREVMAVPGNLGRNYSEGCNALIRQHKAHIFTRIQDLEQVMNWDVDLKDPTGARKRQPFQPEDFPPEEILVLNLLTENTEGVILDEISWKTQIGVSKIASVLLNLEIKGLIRSLPGKKFVIK